MKIATNFKFWMVIAAVCSWPINASSQQLETEIISPKSKTPQLKISSPWITKQFDAQGNWKHRQKPRELVMVSVAASENSHHIPMLGKFEADSKTKSIIFTPRFSLTNGTKYYVTLRDGSKKKLARTSFQTRRAKSDSVKIVAVYPSSNQLPENLLKFYVHFSGPMKRGDIYQFIRIENAAGKAIELPFLEIEQELWSRDQKRLTLLLDPGRIKRGLKPREEMGPILEAGKKYRFVIDRRWTSASGKPLGKNYVKEFTAVKEDTDLPNLDSWKITAPRSNSRQPLTIEFPESLDHSLLLRLIQVFDHKKNPLKGTIKISNHEKTWKFYPNANWQSGQYRIEVDDRLEDLVGNSVGRKFDVDLFKKTQPTSEKKSSLKFNVR